MITSTRTKRAAAVDPSTMARNFSSDTFRPEASRPLAENRTEFIRFMGRGLLSVCQSVCFVCRISFSRVLSLSL